MNLKKFTSILILVVVLTLTLATQGYAHVVVRPGEVGVAERVNFVVSVPTEEDIPTTQVRLVIPEQIKSVRPNVKPGWNIELVKAGEGDSERVSEIIWSGGSIPAEQRDEFVFSSQAPATESELVWKAYQTYASGLIVAWDADAATVEEYEKNNPLPEGVEHDHSAPKPYSTTQVVNDLASDDKGSEVASTNTKTSFDPALGIASGALILSVASLWMQQKKKR